MTKLKIIKRPAVRYFSIFLLEIQKIFIRKCSTFIYAEQNDRDYITIYKNFKSVCTSQSSKAFKLAAAYLQIKKGMASRVLLSTQFVYFDCVES